VPSKKKVRFWPASQALQSDLVVGGEPRCPAVSVRLCTPAVHLPIRPWSPRSQGFPREAASARTEAPRRPAVTSVGATTRRRSTRKVSENLESWLEWREAAERPVPAYVEDELRGYPACGLLCFGFARAVCMTCRTGFVVAFSCKGRGVHVHLRALSHRRRLRAGCCRRRV
jgi:hypothetical protein